MAENKGMDFIREYASAAERYLPLHSDWKGRAKEEGIDPEKHGHIALPPVFIGMSPAG